MASSYRYTKKCIDERRLWLSSLKDKPCSKCGIKYPSYVMDWHHIKRETKKFSLGAGSFRRSRKLILKEVKKCILLCSNCHRIVENTR